MVSVIWKEFLSFQARKNTAFKQQNEALHYIKVFRVVFFLTERVLPPCPVGARQGGPIRPQPNGVRGRPIPTLMRGQIVCG